MKEPVRIVSDLHLGHPASRIDEVAKWLPLMDGVGTLVINGDACEQRYRKWEVRGDEQLRALHSAAEDCGLELIFLRGNHDPWVSEVDYLELADGAMVVTHGDALFRHLSPWSPKVMKLRDQMDAVWAAADTDSLAGWFAAVQNCRTLKPASANESDELSGLGPLTAPLRLVWPPWRVPMMLKCWWQAPGRARDFCERFFPQAKLMVFGHTHWPGVWQRGGRTVMNAGGYLSVGGARVVDVADGKVWVRKVVMGEDGKFAVREKGLFERDLGSL